MLVKSLDKYTGCGTEDCFSQEKDVLMIELSGAPEDSYLQFNADSRYCSLFSKTAFHRARANSVDLLPEMAGETIQGFTLLPGNRIVRMDLVHSKAYFLLFGSARSNLVLTDSDNVIINSFRFAKELKGTLFEEPKSNLKAFTDYGPEDRLSDALGKSAFMLGKYYAQEILTGLGLDPDRTTGSLSGSEKEYLIGYVGQFTEKLRNSKEYYLLETENKKAMLSLVKLRQYPVVISAGNDINAAVEKRVVSSIRHDNFYRGYSQLHGRLAGLERKLLSNISLYSDSSDALARAEQYRNYAELLSSQPNPKEKLGDRIGLSSWEGVRMDIPLDPKLTIIDNSRKYFEKARKARESVEHRKKLLPGLERQLEDVRRKLATLEQSHSLKEISNIGSKGNRMNENENAQKYKMFDLGDGYVLYVGKSAANNDELTMKFARPNDLWFHARGASGSHCVLKAPNDDRVPKTVIKAAAAVAAYYSKAKNAKYTPVAYTQKKYVRKPKGANTGAVVMQKEEVIMVEPGLPASAEE